jgi:hypothetical protein
MGDDGVNGTGYMMTTEGERDCANTSVTHRSFPSDKTRVPIKISGARFVKSQRIEFNETRHHWLASSLLHRREILKCQETWC